MLEKSFLLEMKQHLLEHRSLLLEQIESNSRGIYEISADDSPKDVVDLASTDIDHRLLVSLSHADAKKLTQINAALVRIENHHYGVCMECGDIVAEERLRALPHALFCLPCQKKLEREQR